MLWITLLAFLLRMSLCVLAQYQEHWAYLTSNRLCLVFLYFMTNPLKRFYIHPRSQGQSPIKAPSIFCVFRRHPFHLSADRILAVSWRHCSLKFSQVEIELFLLSLCTSLLGNGLSVLFVPHCRSQTTCPHPKHLLLSENTCFQSV